MNCDKELIIVKRKLTKVQHENQNLSNKLKEVEQVVRKIENLHQEYTKLN
jgi:cell shape-determining protein MreC